MSGYEFTPFGLMPLGTNFGALEEKMAPAVIVEADSVEVPAHIAPPIVVAPVAHHPRVAAQLPVVAPSSPLTSKSLVQRARAELRAIEKEIKRLRALEKQRDELKRLLDAASAKPRPAIRTIARSA